MNENLRRALEEMADRWAADLHELSAHQGNPGLTAEERRTLNVVAGYLQTAHSQLRYGVDQSRQHDAR